MGGCGLEVERVVRIPQFSEFDPRLRQSISRGELMQDTVPLSAPNSCATTMRGSLRLEMCDRVKVQPEHYKLLCIQVLSKQPFTNYSKRVK